MNQDRPRGYGWVAAYARAFFQNILSVLQKLEEFYIEFPYEPFKLMRDSIIKKIKKLLTFGYLICKISTVNNKYK